MKALTFILAMLMTIGITTEAEAQYSRRGYQGNNGGGDTYASNTSNSSRYGYDGRLSRRERQRYQERLEDRAYDLKLYEQRLNRREARLEGRRVRSARIPSRRNYQRALLTANELRAWDTRLDRRERRLVEFERELDRRERRRGRRNRARTGSGGGGGYCPPGW